MLPIPVSILFQIVSIQHWPCVTEGFFAKVDAPLLKSKRGSSRSDPVILTSRRAVQHGGAGDPSPPRGPCGLIQPLVSPFRTDPLPSCPSLLEPPSVLSSLSATSVIASLSRPLCPSHLRLHGTVKTADGLAFCSLPVERRSRTESVAILRFRRRR